jgi:hypothetical protein
MSRRSREREVRDGVGHFLTARGANDPAAFLSGVGVLIENCKRHDLLGFRYEDRASIGEGLSDLREKRQAVDAAGAAYMEGGGRANREAWQRTMVEWLGVLEGTTMLMHVALEQASVTPNQDLKPVELAGIVPASNALDRVLTELDLLEQFGVSEGE